MSGDWKDKVAYGVVVLIIIATFLTIFLEVGGAYRAIPKDEAAPGCTRRPCN